MILPVVNKSSVLTKVQSFGLPPWPTHDRIDISSFAPGGDSSLISNSTTWDDSMHEGVTYLIAGVSLYPPLVMLIDQSNQIHYIASDEASVHYLDHMCLNRNFTFVKIRMAYEGSILLSIY